MSSEVVKGSIMQNHENEGMQPHRLSPNSIQDLKFVIPQENPDPRSGIQQAMKLLASINEQLHQITNRIEGNLCIASQAYCQIVELETREKHFRWIWTDNGKKLASLKQDLDKLTFPNNGYNEKSIKTEDQKINIHNLQFLMHHGINNMAKERKLLKEINTSQNNSCNSGLSIRKLQWNYHPLPDPQQEIIELKWAEDKAFPKNSLPSKNVIKKQIKLMEKASCDEERMEHLRIRAKIQQLKQQRNAAVKDIGSLKREFLDEHRKKGKAYKLLLKFIKIRDQGM